MTVVPVTNRCPQVYEKSVAGVRTVEVCMAGQLAAGEYLTGTPSVTVSPSGLTLSAATINEDIMPALVPAERGGFRVADVAPGKVIIVSASGGQPGVEYEITVACWSDGDPAQYVDAIAQLNVA